MEEQKTTIDVNENAFEAIEYKSDFELDSLKPMVGNIFNFYISTSLLAPISSTNQKQQHPLNIWGCTHYTPNSDLAAVAMHSGALFIHPKSKSAIRRRFCTMKNFFEVQNCSEAEYSKIAQFIEIPLDLTVKGVVLQILIDNSPSSFPSVQRNGVKSQEQHTISPYAIRVANFFVISMYDDMPKLVTPEEYVRKTAVVPTFKFSITGEVGIVFKPHMFLQIFSRFNIVNGFFKFNYLYFDIENTRYQLLYKSGTQFQVIKFTDPPTINILKRKQDPAEYGEVIHDSVELSEISVTSKGILVKKQELAPIDIILVSPSSNDSGRN